ncbi:MAG: protein translocase subunit SecF, partial [Spirochaetaceae bacterium]
QQVLSFKDYPTLEELSKALSGIKGVGVQLVGAGTTPTSLLLGASDKLDPGRKMFLNHGLPVGSVPSVTIVDLRQILESLYTGTSIQILGEPIAQEFLIRLDAEKVTVSEQAAGANQDVYGMISESIKTQIEKKYGEGWVIVKQQESLGPQLAQSLASGSVIAIIVALLCMLIYVSIRFQYQFAFAAVMALVHDALFTIALVGVFQVEVSSAVIAALLTIIGFSINDTIVIFDRIRENQLLMKGTDFATLIDSSISQTMSRTLITSITVLLSIVPLYILGTGVVKDFSFCMVYGVISGSYSTIFIAAPIVYGWRKTFLKKQQEQDQKLYGRAQVPSFGEEKLEEGGTSGVEQIGEAGVETGTPRQAQAQERVVSEPSGPITRVQRVLEKKKKRHR